MNYYSIYIKYMNKLIYFDIFKKENFFMALQIRNNAHQVQEIQQGQNLSWPERTRQRVIDTWNATRETVSNSCSWVCNNKGKVAGGAVLGAATIGTAMLVGPGLALTGATSILSTIFRRTIYDVADNGVQQATDAIRHVSTELSGTLNASVRRLNATLHTLGVQGLQIFETLGHRAVYALEVARDRGFATTEIALGTGLSLVGFVVLNRGASSENNFVCLWAQNVFIMTSVAGTVYLVGKNILLSRRQQAAIVNGDFREVVAESFQARIMTTLSTTGRTPLMEAALQGNTPVLLQLQRQGADLEARDLNGRTALHYAAEGNQQKTFEWLWYFGANIEAMSRTGDGAIKRLQQGSAFHQQAARLMQTENRFGHKPPIYFFYPPENLVFKGGGPRGIAYVGALSALEERNLLRDVRRTAGTSAGAITASLVALGYTSDELRQILEMTDLLEFLDHQFQAEQEITSHVVSLFRKNIDASFRDVYHFGKSVLKVAFGKGQRGLPSLFEKIKKTYKSGGFCEGNTFSNWIQNLIAIKAAKVCGGDRKDYKNLTFGELRQRINEGKPFKHLYLWATKIDGDPTPVCINSEDERWDSVTIASAIRASMSIPLAFEPYTLCTQDDGGNSQPAPELGLFMDGGLLVNLPIKTFDHPRFRSTNSARGDTINYQTLAFNLVDPPFVPVPKETENPDLLEAVGILGTTIASAEDILAVNDPNYQMRMINISNCGIGLLTGFAATPDDKGRLIRSGSASGNDFVRRQEELAKQHAQHDPAKILTIFALQPKMAVPQMPSAVQIEDITDQQPVVEDVKESVTVEQMASHLTTTRENLVQQSDGSMAMVTETAQISQIIQRQTKQLAASRQMMQNTAQRQQRTAVLLQQLLNQK